MMNGAVGHIQIIIGAMDRNGHIELILGPMFSGKSSQMMRKVRRFEHAKKKCLVVNYLNDNRYSFEDIASTHDKVTMKAVKTNGLEQIYDKAKQFDVVAIDEGQFFAQIAEVSERLANEGVIVIVAALDGTFQRKPFGNILLLVPLAEQMTKLSAVCVECGKEAAFTKRTIESQEVEIIGGEEMYKPLCRGCFGLIDSRASPSSQPQVQSPTSKANPQSSQPIKQ